MTDTPTATALVVAPPARARWQDLIPVIALVLTMITLLVGGGKALGKVEDNTRRITTLEQRADRRDDEQSQMRAGIAAINAKLDLLLERAGAERR